MGDGDTLPLIFNSGMQCGLYDIVTLYTHHTGEW